MNEEVNSSLVNEQKARATLGRQPLEGHDESRGSIPYT